MNQERPHPHQSSTKNTKEYQYNISIREKEYKQTHTHTQKELKTLVVKRFKDVENPYLDSVPSLSFDHNRIFEEITNMRYENLGKRNPSYNYNDRYHRSTKKKKKKKTLICLYKESPKIKNKEG